MSMNNSPNSFLTLVSMGAARAGHVKQLEVFAQYVTTTLPQDV